MNTTNSVICYKSKTLANGEHLEKPQLFDPRGQSFIDPLQPFILAPFKVLTDGVNFILPYFFLALILRRLSPASSIRCAECTILSSTASATVGSPMASYKLYTGSCEDTTIDFLPCRSSMRSNRIERSLTTIDTRKASSRMSSWHLSIFFSSFSKVPFTFATFSMPSSLVVFAYSVRIPFLQAW